MIGNNQWVLPAASPQKKLQIRVAIYRISLSFAGVNMNDQIVQKLEEKGFKLPNVPAAAGSYVQALSSGNLLYLSGGLPLDGDTLITGKVGVDLTIEQAQQAALLCVLGRLAVIRAELGSLERISQIITLNGFVNSGPDFYEHPKVINGASDFLIEIFGERGKHTRTALGAPALPLNAAVELNLIVQFTE